MTMNASEPGDFQLRLATVYVCFFWGALALILWLTGGALAAWSGNDIAANLQPKSNLKEINADVAAFQRQHNRLPASLGEFVALKKKWVLNRQKESNVRVVKESGDAKNRRDLTVVRYRNYSYLYAPVNRDTAVLWAFPDPYIPPGYEQTAKPEQLAEARRQQILQRTAADVYCVVYQENKIRIFQGINEANLNLEKIVTLLEPTPAQLSALNLREQNAQ